MMMVGRSAAGQLPYSPLIQLSLIVRTTDCKNKQKDKRFIKICFFLSSQLMISIKKILEKWFSEEVLYQNIFPWLRVPFPPHVGDWGKLFWPYSGPRELPPREQTLFSRHFQSTQNTDLLQQEIQLWMDLMQNLFFIKIREIWHILIYNFHKNPLCVLSSLYTFQSTQKHH